MSNHTSINGLESINTLHLQGRESQNDVILRAKKSQFRLIPILKNKCKDLSLLRPVYEEFIIFWSFWTEFKEVDIDKNTKHYDKNCECEGNIKNKLFLMNYNSFIRFSSFIKIFVWKI